MDLITRRRELMMMSGGDPFADWVKIIINKASAGEQYLFDGNTSRVPDTAIAGTRIVLDGVEITPVRSINNMAAGEHTVYYLIPFTSTNWWWYWVGNIKSVIIPAAIQSINPESFTMAANPSVQMTFYGYCPYTSVVTAAYIKNRPVFCTAAYRQDFEDVGFTNITTI